MNETTNQRAEKRFYDRKTEETMRRFYNSLNEKDRRRYAGVEALKIGHGGHRYIADVLGCNRQTVSKGVNEVANLPKKK